ncbi:hypothetical protein WA026_011971 [Henosepilachna vigintioctopunctata]|uniref:Uncharacterized protein n=1 Tax=Henosepilachna vigintioctopunctata TaxID=420089 RepID=A0AAW1V4J2_9CUCU
MSTMFLGSACFQESHINITNLSDKDILSGCGGDFSHVEEYIHERVNVRLGRSGLQASLSSFLVHVKMRSALIAHHPTFHNTVLCRINRVHWIPKVTINRGAVTTAPLDRLQCNS